ncbi:hypothetical protein HYW44_00455 [Candidatus Daviesbacteria bacterium]|nr:hypothetical protein [Candidatus Daviesbacteria bacterium]
MTEIPVKHVLLYVHEDWELYKFPDIPVTPARIQLRRMQTAAARYYGEDPNSVFIRYSSFPKKLDGLSTNHAGKALPSELIEYERKRRVSYREIFGEDRLLEFGYKPLPPVTKNEVAEMKDRFSQKGWVFDPGVTRFFVGGENIEECVLNWARAVTYALNIPPDRVTFVPGICYTETESRALIQAIATYGLLIDRVAILTAIHSIREKQATRGRTGR